MESPRKRRSMPGTEPVQACPLCGEAASEKVWTLPDRLYGVPGEYRYVRCTGCESVYQSPRVRSEDLHLCYPSGYYTHSAEGEDTVIDGEPTGEGPAMEEARVEESGAMEEPLSGESGLRGLRDRVRWWIRWAVQGGSQPGGASPAGVAGEAREIGGPGGASRPGFVGQLVGGILSRSRALRERAFFGLIDPVIPRSRDPGRALEIGAGSGWELSLLRRVGWDAEGVEFDPAAAEAAARDYGLSVRVGDFLDVVDADERYDLVYLSHVFEHLPDLEEAFRFFERHLRPGGRAVLRFPNLRSLGVRMWERHWQGWDPPRHLVLPSREGIRALARRAPRSGLRVRIETRARDAAFIHAASRAIEERYRDPGGGAGSERPADPLNPPRGWSDRLRALFEAILVTLGLPLGEETVVVLEVAQ